MQGTKPIMLNSVHPKFQLLTVCHQNTITQILYYSFH